MIQTAIGLALAVLLAGGLATIPAVAIAADDGAMATVHRFIDAFNRGDIAAAQATNAPDVVIIDEFPPHEWHGPGAFQAWLGDLGKTSQAAGQTDEKVSFDRTVRDQVDGDTAYAVVGVVYTYTQHGAPIVEPARMALALRDEAGVWKITGWGWAGDKPHPKP